MTTKIIQQPVLYWIKFDDKIGPATNPAYTNYHPTITVLKDSIAYIDIVKSECNRW